jgi:hypothetical protein
MATESQIAANRRNAVKSRGPITSEGKARCAAAPLKSGLYAKAPVLPTESRAGLEQLIAEWYARHRPTTPEARAILDELVFCEWTLRRLRLCEAQLWEDSAKDVYPSRKNDALAIGQGFDHADRTMARLQYRIDSTRRAFYRAKDQLARLALEQQEEAATGASESGAPAPVTSANPAKSVGPELGPSVNHTPEPSSEFEQPAPRVNEGLIDSHMSRISGVSAPRFAIYSSSLQFVRLDTFQLRSNPWQIMS